MSVAHAFALRRGRATVPKPAQAADTPPDITIDPGTAEILAASERGYAALGLFPYASFPIALDPAMPAIERLRQVTASEITEHRDPETLMFWGNGRQKPVKCRVTPRTRGRIRVIELHILDGDRSDTAAPPHPPTEEESVEASDARAAPEPAETLKEIAKQIREGRFEVRPHLASASSKSRTPAPGESNVASTGEASVAIDETGRSSTAQKSAPVLDPDHLAKLAHELKTPLTAIAAAAEIMRDQRLGEMGNARYLSYAGDIHENATHALDVISSLLSESGRPNTSATRLIALDLNALAERTVSSLQSLAQSRGLTLAFEGDKSRPHVVANPTALRQILLNLLTNAIKFTPRSGDICVVTGYLTDGRVFLVVRDTGCGMLGQTPVQNPCSAEEAMFQPGRGIGLPLVRRLVREMGAEMEIDSAPQRGTVVLIAFGGFARWPA